MGLDATIVAVVEKSLERFDSVLTYGPRGISASPDTLNRIATGGWSREVVQPYGFLVNGPSGTLAPKELGQIPTMHQLSLDLSDGQGVIRDSSGRELDQVFWIAPSRSDGRNDLARILANSNTEDQGSVGIPQGTISVESPTGNLLSKRWLLAMGELLDDGTLTIRPAGRPQFTLLVIRPGQRQNMAELLRRGSRVGYDVLRQDGNKTAGQDIPKNWDQHAVCQAGDGKLVITLRQADVVDILIDEEDDAEFNDFSSDEGSISERPATSVPPSLLVALGRTYLWTPFSFTVRTILPGDAATAALMLKLQGIEALRKLAMTEPAGPFDISAWWNDRQSESAANWPDGLKTIRVPLADLLALARRSPDSDLVEFVSEIP
jgi:hypothetical protein